MSSEAESVPLIRTKLYRPRISGGLVPRPRLLERLEERRDRPLTLVSAPAGYGKTTLVSNWLEACDCPNAWLSLDEEDDDLSLFLSYLLAAIETMFPGAVAETQALAGASSLPPLPVLARSLINELDQIDRSFILALDDFHYIQCIAVHDLLNELLAHPPRPMHLVLISRRDPALDLVRLRARRQVTEVRTQELRFTQAETATFVEQEMGQPFHDDAVSALLQRVEGWVTGLRLITLSLRHRGSLSLSGASLQGSSSYVTEYLVAEVLQSQPQAVQDYLLNTSILDRFCAPLCEAVCSGQAEASAVTDECEIGGQAFVEWLEENDPFLVRLDDRCEWYRYHHLFQDLLQNRLEQQSGPEGVAVLHGRASAWFAQNKLIDEALQHALAGGDTATAVSLVAQQRHDLINREQWRRLERWLRLFDRATIDHSPELSVTEAWVSNHHARVDEQLAALDRTERLLANTDLPQGVSDLILGEALVLRANLLAWHNQAAEALATVERARGLLPEQYQYAHAAISMISGFAYAQLGKDRRAERALLTGLEEQRIGDNPKQQSLLLYALARWHWTTLDIQGLKQTATRYRQYGREFGLPESEMVALHFSGWAHYHRNELAKAKECLSVPVSNPYLTNRSIYAQAVCGLALTHLALGQPMEARKLLDESRSNQMGQIGRVPIDALQAAQAQVALALGDVARPIRWAETYDPLPIGGLQMLFIPQLSLVRVLLAQNTYLSLGKASALLSQFIELARDRHIKSALMGALPLQALLNDVQGDQSAALASLEESVRLGEAEGLVRVFLDLGSHMADLLGRLSRRDVAPDYIARTLAAFAGETESALSPVPGPLSPLVEALTPRELEVLALLTQGLSNKEIAGELVLATSSVKQYTHRIYQKLGVKNRQQAATAARNLGIVAPM